MEKEKVVVFLDYANVNRTAREKRYRLDYHDLLYYMSEERFLIDAYCYVPINPRNEHRRDGVIEDLWRDGYIVTSKIGTIAGGTYKCNFDVEITMDVLKVVHTVKPDIIVLASGDADFVSLIQDVRKAGVRVEVAAFEENAGADMMSKCSGFIDLAVYYAGYLAAQNGARAEQGKAEQYKDLIQSQIGEQDEDGKAEQDERLLQLHESDLHEDEVKFEDQVDSQTHIAAPDLIDELDMKSTTDWLEGEETHGNY